MPPTHSRSPRVLLLGFGSRGDVEPFVALALGLQAAGRDVAVVAGRDYGPWVESFGVPALPFSIDMEQAMRSTQGRGWLGATSHDPFAQLRAMKGVFREFAPTLAMDLRRVVRPGDQVVSSSITFNPMLTLAEQRSARHVFAAFTPGIPTRSGPSSLAPLVPQGDSPLNLVTGTVAMLAMWQVMKRPADLVRASFGLSRDSAATYARRATRVPCLFAVSQHLMPRPPDWPDAARVTGAWQLSEDSTGELSPQVEAFLDAGEPPVYLGLGSMTNPDPVATMRILVGAAQQAGVRAVVHRGVDLQGAELGHLVDDEHRDRILFVDAVPHARLLPRCAAAISHGGSGTTHRIARSGVPQVVIPHIGDQPYWGRRVHELRLGPAPIRRADLTTANLAAAVRTLVTDEGGRHRAQVLGRQIAAERGVEAAVQILDRLSRA